MRNRQAATLTALCGAIALVMSGMAATAGPGSKKGKGHNKHKTVVVHKTVVHHGGPPPWAPAHGYRAKRGGGYSGGYGAGGGYAAPYGISSGHCNRKEVGTVIGAVAGGVIGNRVVKKEDRLIGTLGGVFIGALVGRTIGKRMDKVDHHCVAQTLEHAPDGRSVSWRNPDQDVNHRVTAVRTVEGDGGRYCREYRSRSIVGGREVDTYGTACRGADGTWDLAG